MSVWGSDVMVVAKLLKAKVCLVGSAGVGKTSLIRRFVLDMFDDLYITTIGTKVSRKDVRISLPDMTVVDVSMTIWDIMGQLGFREILKDAYFHGAHGLLAVGDLTRPATVEELGDWVESATGVAGTLPVVVALNKADLAAEAPDRRDEVRWLARTHPDEILRTSAKFGDNVEEAFRALAKRVARQQLQSR